MDSQENTGGSEAKGGLGFSEFYMLAMYFILEQSTSLYPKQNIPYLLNS